MTERTVLLHRGSRATGEIRVETADRATGYWTTRSDRPGLNARTAVH
jgi:hypothetical protein